jgi:hypothetical protein
MCREDSTSMGRKTASRIHADMYLFFSSFMGAKLQNKSQGKKLSPWDLTLYIELFLFLA